MHKFYFRMQKITAVHAGNGSNHGETAATIRGAPLFRRHLDSRRATAMDKFHQPGNEGALRR